ncbi:MAG: serine hydrolase domain-containing protein [Planctomycetota bacterium]|jgi:CubicO group peptidase (beta-lactamase class C family)
MRPTLISSILALTAILPTASSTPRTQDVVAVEAGFAVEVDALRREYGLPALAGALIDRDGRIVLSGSAGLVATGSDTLVDGGSSWHLGSCTKAMTASLAAIDVAAGRLSWNSSPAAVLRGWGPVDDPLWRPDDSWGLVTLGQLLSHTGAAPTIDDLPLAWLAQVAHEGTPSDARRDLVRTLLSRPADLPSGEEFRYSNLGYAIVGAMLEEVGGRPFEQRLRGELFAPLGITGGGFGPPQRDQDPIGHRLDGLEVDPVGRDRFADNPRSIAPAGTVHLPLADWARFVGLHLRRGSGEGDPLVAESFSELHRPRLDNYALGWVVLDRPWSEGKVLHHAGSNTFWYASVWAAPSEGFAMIACTNVASEGARLATDALIGRLLEERGRVSRR